MTAAEKTSDLVRMSLPLNRLVKNELNPNKMSTREFDLLVDNMQRTGLTDAILVTPVDREGFNKLQKSKSKLSMPELILKSEAQFRIVGGHHRYDGASYLQMPEVPVTIITDPDFDADAENFQMVRMNMIRGRMDPTAFFDLYQSMQERYSDEIMQTAFGFAEEAEFKRLIAQTAKSIEDPTMKKKFQEAAAEVKTVDGLAKLLNTIFTKYGDTMPFGYMIFDHAGQRSVWLRIKGDTMKALDLIGEMCVEQQRSVDDILGYLIREATKGRTADILKEAIEKSKPVSIPEGMGVMPTEDNLEKLGEA